MTEAERIKTSIAGMDKMLKEYPYSEPERRDIEVARARLEARLAEVEKEDGVAK